AYLGPASYREYHALAEEAVPRLRARHLGVDSPKNLIFVPGVMGSLLDSEELGGIWWIDLRSLGHIDRLRLARGGLKDAESDARIRAFNVDVSYEPFGKAVLKRDDFGHVALPYDWRKPLDHCADGLREKVLELHAGNGSKPVHLVAHSMGGLVVRAALRLF